jgi:hypothetical protein
MGTSKRNQKDSFDLHPLQIPQGVRKQITQNNLPLTSGTFSTPSEHTSRSDSHGVSYGPLDTKNPHDHYFTVQPIIDGRRQ